MGTLAWKARSHAMTVFEIIAAATGVGVGIVVMFGGVVAITLHISKISSKINGVVAKID